METTITSVLGPKEDEPIVYAQDRSLARISPKEFPSLKKNLGSQEVESSILKSLCHRTTRLAHSTLKTATSELQSHHHNPIKLSRVVKLQELTPTLEIVIAQRTQGQRWMRPPDYAKVDQ